METTPIIRLVNEYYEHELFNSFQIQDKLGFYNVGYWKGIDNSIELAQINLIETLLSFLSNRQGTVLDVACGKGASTKYLTKYFDSSQITGINISEHQLSVCRVIAPECNFKLMDATRMELEDSSVDNILCIEAAFHFLTRRRFLQEAHRVLVPGGRVAMSDVLFNEDAVKITPTLCPENAMPDLDAYRQQLLQVGFRHVRVEDSTQFAFNRLLDAITRHREEHFNQADEAARRRFYSDAEQFRAINPICCMVYAIK